VKVTFVIDAYARRIWAAVRLLETTRSSWTLKRAVWTRQGAGAALHSMLEHPIAGSQ
jgi:hypothetical protein